MTDAVLIRHDAGSIARLTLNTPENLNALSDAMLAALDGFSAAGVASQTAFTDRSHK